LSDPEGVVYQITNHKSYTFDPCKDM